MAIATAVRKYLEGRGVDYGVVPHSHTDSASGSAASAHVPGDQLAKSVIVEDENGYLMVVLPATHRLELGTLHRQLKRNVGLATEAELSGLFSDCELGAVPAIGAAYGLETILDESLLQQHDVYFEAGDHTELIHVSGDQFRNLMDTAQTFQCSHHI